MTQEDLTVSATLMAANEFTDWLKIRGVQKTLFTVQVSGTFVGTLTVQIRDPDDAVAIDVEPTSGPITQPGMYNGNLAGGYDVRIGFKAGAYSSGSALCRIKQSGKT